MPMTVPYAAIAPQRVSTGPASDPRDEELLQRRSAARSRSFSASGAAQSAYAPGHPGRVRLPDTAPALPAKRVKRRVRRAGGQQLPTQQRKAGPGHSLRRKTQQEQAQSKPQNTLARVNGGQLPNLSTAVRYPPSTNPAHPAGSSPASSRRLPTAAGSCSTRPARTGAAQ